MNEALIAVMIFCANTFPPAYSGNGKIQGCAEKAVACIERQGPAKQLDAGMTCIKEIQAANK